MSVQQSSELMNAALAVAAELAKNGGMSMNIFLSDSDDGTEEGERERVAVASPVVVSASPEPIFENNSHYEKDDEILDENHMEDANTVEDILNSDDEFEGEDAEKRLVRSRERNREHARRTRLRKKAQLAALEIKAKGLEAESQILKQSVEECSIASILVGISTGSSTTNSVTESLLDVSNLDEKREVGLLLTGKRKRFTSEDVMEKVPQQLKIKIDGQLTLIGGGKTHINWKSGVYCDDHGVQRQLTQKQLESLRRERNRMHAKMTRDRKKNFISAIEKTIEQLETNNRKMRDVLHEVAKKHPCVTPQPSPLVAPMDLDHNHVPQGFSLAAL